MIMLHRTISISLLASACAACLGQAHARTPIPVDALAKVPQIQSVSMSSDGKNLVAIVPKPDSNREDTAVASWNLDNLDAGATLTPSGDRMKFIAANALKANRVLVVGRQEWTGALAGCGEGKTTGSTKTFVNKIYLTDTSLKKFEEAFAANVRRVGVSEQVQRCLELSGSANLVSRLPLDPDHVIIQRLNQTTLTGAYYKYNLRTDEATLLFQASPSKSPGLFDPRDGKVLVENETIPLGGREYEQRVALLNAAGEFQSHPKLTTKLSERHSVDIVGRDEATGKYYVLTDQFSDLVQARMYDPAKGEYDPEPLVAHPQYSITGLVLGMQPSNFNQVLGYVIGDAQGTVEYVDERLGRTHATLAKSMPGRHVQITGYNDDMSRVLFEASSPRHPPSYHLLLDGQRVVNLGSERPEINPEDIGEQRWITYTARDGKKIPAILDLPAGWSPKDGRLPAIVHPHGGPWARDYGGWDGSGWVPFLTSRGYAVIRPQYRGSTGLGRQLWMAGDAQWGQAMQDDKDDAAKWLVEQGIAAPDRIAIFGYSYGGFSAAAAAVRPGGPFQCAISGAPVTDLARLGTSWSENRLQRILQGRTVTGMDPMRNTDKASIPVLIYVGDRDVRTPQFHAESFYEAIRGRVPAKFQLIADMPHSMPWYPRHQRETLTLIENFLAKDCGPGGL